MIISTIFCTHNTKTFLFSKNHESSTQKPLSVTDIKPMPVECSLHIHIGTSTIKISALFPIGAAMR